MKEAGQVWKGAGLVLAWAFGWLVSLGAQEEERKVGHYDLAVNYDVESGWDTYIRDYGGGSPLEPERTILVVGDNAREEVPAGEAFGFLGEAGEAVWILPEIYDAERLWLGFGAPLLGRDLFRGGLSNRGELSLRLEEVSGSGVDAGGEVALWVSGVPPLVHFASADGIGPEDALEGITANFHAHYNWGFTEAGLYRITFSYSGQLVEALGGEEVSTRVTYQFAVGDWGGGVLRYGWERDDGWGWSSWLGWYREVGAPWIYSVRHGWLGIPEGHPEHFWIYIPEEGWGRSGQRVFPAVWMVERGEWMQL